MREREKWGREGKQRVKERERETGMEIGIGIGTGTDNHVASCVGYWVARFIIFHLIQVYTQT